MSDLLTTFCVIFLCVFVPTIILGGLGGIEKTHIPFILGMKHYVIVIDNDNDCYLRRVILRKDGAMCVAIKKERVLVLFEDGNLRLEGQDYRSYFNSWMTIQEFKKKGLAAKRWL